MGPRPRSIHSDSSLRGRVAVESLAMGRIQGCAPSALRNRSSRGSARDSLRGRGTLELLRGATAMERVFAGRGESNPRLDALDDREGCCFLGGDAHPWHRQSLGRPRILGENSADPGPRIFDFTVRPSWRIPGGRFFSHKSTPAMDPGPGDLRVSPEPPAPWIGLPPEGALLSGDPSALPSSASGAPARQDGWTGLPKLADYAAREEKTPERCRAA